MFPGSSCWVGRHGGGCLVFLGGWWVVADSRVGTDQNPTLADFRELGGRVFSGWLWVVADLRVGTDQNPPLADFRERRAGPWDVVDSPQTSTNDIG